MLLLSCSDIQRTKHGIQDIVFSGAVSEADGSKIQDVRISKYCFLILLNATSRTPLFDKALETLYPVLTTEQQQELDVFSAPPGGVSVEEIQLTNALVIAANAGSAENTENAGPTCPP